MEIDIERGRKGKRDRDKEMNIYQYHAEVHMSSM